MYLYLQGLAFGFSGYMPTVKVLKNMVIIKFFYKLWHDFPKQLVLWYTTGLS